MEDGLYSLGPWSFLAAHLIGAGGLLLCNAGSNMAVVGCSIDAEHRDGTDILWPMDYLTRIVQRNCAGCIEVIALNELTKNELTNQPLSIHCRRWPHSA